MAGPRSRGLVEARVGDAVVLRTPIGAQEIEVVAARYRTRRSGRRAA